MRFPVLILGLFWLAAPAAAQSLCDVTDASRIREIAVGTWVGETHRALESETLSRVQADITTRVTVENSASGLTIDSEFLDSLRGEPFVLEPRSEAYDDEQVEEVLTGTTDSLANDQLNDRTCSAYVLPQLEADLPKTEGISASGTVTLIFYRPDLALQLSELTLESPETVIYATESAWLTKTGVEVE